MSEVTEEDLEVMTAEEREAYLNDDDAELESKPVQVVEESEAPAAEAAAPAATETKVETPAVELDDDIDTPPAIPFQAQAPADADAQIAEIKKAKAAAFQRLMDGDEAMTAEAYQKVEQEAADKIAALQAQKLKAEISAEMSQQQMAAAWDRACATFAQRVKATEGIDYTEPNGLGVMWDAQIKRLASDQANANQPASWFLSEAHKAVMKAIGRDPAKPAAPAPAKTAARTPDRSLIPPVLSQLPQAVNPSATSDEFAHLANLSGDDYERALASMTPDQQRRFLDS